MPENTSEETAETYRVALKHVHGEIGKLKTDIYYLNKLIDGLLVNDRKREAQFERLKKREKKA